MQRCMQIFYTSFGFVPLMKSFYGDDTAENHAKSAKLHWQAQAEHVEKYPSVPAVCIKCIYTDPATGEEQIVGYSQWYMFDRIRTEQEWAEPVFLDRFSWITSDEDREKCRGFMKPLQESQRRLLADTPVGHLRGMCVDPQFRRRGVGSLLVKWGMKQCGRLGMPAYLDTSPNGMYMYEKLGFQKMANSQYPAMIWWPQPNSSQA